MKNLLIEFCYGCITFSTTDKYSLNLQKLKLNFVGRNLNVLEFKFNIRYTNHNCIRLQININYTFKCALLFFTK